MKKEDISQKSRFTRRIYRQILWILIITSMVNIAGNLMIDYPDIANIKWVVVLIIGIVILKFGMITEKRDYIMFVLLILITYVVFPLGWYNSGSAHNNALAYLFLLVIGITILFNGYQRLFLLVSVVGIFIGLLLIEYYIPDLLPVRDQRLSFMDRIIQIPLVVLISVGILIQFADTLRDKYNELEAANEKLHKMVYTDALTGLGNRAYIFDCLARFIRKGDAFVTLMIDLDNFKYVNDTFGHMEGDRLLIRLAEILRECFDSEAQIARYGGDEFIIILHQPLDRVDELTAVFLETVREKVRIGAYGATISGGYALYEAGMELDNYLRKVDEILYSAKGHGKDQILNRG